MTMPKVVAVSKKQSVDKIRQLYSLGVKDFAENYLQEALLKREELSDLDICWHFIGNIQSKKIKELVGNFYLIQTVSRVSEAEKISKRALELGIDQRILIQLNIANEESKQGFAVAEIESSIEQIRKLPNVTLEGMMVFPPLSEKEVETSEWFQKSFKIFEGLRDGSATWGTLSMGTSQDFALATRYGSTLLRLGETLMGPREVS